jgi:hypothetical protein
MLSNPRRVESVPIYRPINPKTPAASVRSIPGKTV